MTIAEKELTRYNRVLWLRLRNPYTQEELVYPVRKFIEDFIKIKDKDGNIVPLILNDAQVDVYRTLCEQLIRGERMRLDILKARQLGMSTFIAAFYTATTLLVPNQKAVIVANTSDNASFIFEIYKRMYDFLPDWIHTLIPQVKSNAKEVAVKFSNGVTSSIRIDVADQNTGRGSTINKLHISEGAFILLFKEITRGLFQTVATSDPYSVIIIETTANGFNDYKVMYDKHCSPDSIFKALFYPRFTDKKYVERYNGFELTDNEEKMMKDFNLTYEQIAWYRYKYEEVDKDIDTMRQEYPSTPLEAFITSGNSFFSSDLLQKRKSELLGKKFDSYEFVRDEFYVTPQGDGYKIKNPRLVKKSNGLIKIFRDVIANHPYIVNVDPALGGEDYFVAQVFDNYAFEQVARLRIHKSSNFRWIGLQIYCLTHYYNDALLNAECNNSTGTLILEIARKCGHTFIYQDSSVETLGVRYEDKYGYKTKSNNKNYMCDLFEVAFRDNYKMINDWDTLCEMETFQTVTTANGKSETHEAVGGGHDDLVTAFFGIFLARSKMIQTTLLTEERKTTKYSIEELEEKMRHNRETHKIVTRYPVIWH